MILGAQFLPERRDEYIDSVRVADEVGYARAWLVDGQMLWHDVWIYLALGLDATEQIAFGPAVTNPFTRHLTVTASAAATLDQLYPGRFLLGLPSRGRGDNAVRTLGLEPVPTRVLYETVPQIRALAAGEEIALNGREVRIRWAEQADVPIMLAATGPKNLRAAGALADIVMVYVGVHPDAVRWAIDHVRAGAEEAGRIPTRSRSACSRRCGWTTTRRRRDRCRWAPAACANHVADVARRNAAHGMPERMTRLVQARDDYDYYAGHLDSTAEHTAYLTGELIDDFALAGSAEKVLARLAELAALGVHEVSCAYLNGSLEQMRRVGREVMPGVRALPVGRPR